MARTGASNGSRAIAFRPRSTANRDFVLHVEEIGERFIDPLGPEVIAGPGVDQLHVDAHAVSAALNATLGDIADVNPQPIAE
jgi:hypothetical protein